MAVTDQAVVRDMAGHHELPGKGGRHLPRLVGQGHPGRGGGEGGGGEGGGKGGGEGGVEGGGEGGGERCEFEFHFNTLKKVSLNKLT